MINAIQYDLSKLSWTIYKKKKNNVDIRMLINSEDN